MEASKCATRLNFGQHFTWQVGTPSGGQWWARGPKGRSANWPIGWCHLAKHPTDLRTFQKVSGTHSQSTGRSTNLQVGPIYSRFTPTNLPHVWQCSNRPSKAVGRSVHPRVEKEGARGLLTWHPLSHPYIMRGPPSPITHLPSIISFPNPTWEIKCSVV